MVVKTFCENAHAYIKAKSNGNSPVGLTLKMEYFIQELMNDNGTILYFIKRNVDLSIILLNFIQNRHVPRVSNFADNCTRGFIHGLPHQIKSNQISFIYSRQDINNTT